MNPLRIGITCGDVNGIGPEVALKAVSAMKENPAVELVLIGPRQVFDTPAKWQVELHEDLRPGRMIPDASRTAMAAIHKAVRGCLEGSLDAMVTAPICKEGLQQVGCPYPGHTEMIAALTGTQRFGMMLAGKNLRVMLATRHLPLRAVPDALSLPLVLDAIRLTAETLRWLGLPRKAIAVCGLNPHAGDGGVLGSEEAGIIQPAIETAKAEGIDVAGPLPADAVFFEALKGRYDAVVAMYHDQGLGPLKTIAFDCGINLTVGLPIVRTSPDHGTAFAIAGTGTASPDSMIAAIEMAITLAGKTNPWACGAPCP